ncbi:hypothetical protein BY996DRAFT_4583714 [Phakopsora pachyrhizi]|uniref:Alpha-aminoadipate reductase n=1 Tax=Phakopsora pachyrhizi TaxID=170000 RepID=A0AAV0AUW7_PHAPC|nr:hypothetical protein BY996DRAFT_4583714 [Phakopsora pachyrhizi]CAH7672621.1 hypothetical protein PPACK8108_LOCUS7435 [Phakopsora pachyrhizi]
MDDDRLGKLSRISNRLKSLPLIALPTDFPRPSRSAHQKLVESSVDCCLDHRSSLALARLSLHDIIDPSNQPSPFQLLLTTFLVLLHRYTGETDIVVATSSPSADHLDPLLLRANLQPDRPFWSLVKEIGELQREAEADHVPFDQLLEAVGQREGDSSDSSYAPLFRVRFLDATDNTGKDFLHSTSLTTDITIVVKSATQITQSSHQPILPRPLSLSVLYNSLLFSSSRIHILVEQLENVLTQASLQPESRIGTIPLLGPLQQPHLPDPLEDLNWTTWPGPITEIFSRNALRHPERPCVIERSVQLISSDLNGSPVGYGQKDGRLFTYRQINEASNVLAHHLVLSGIIPEEVVTVYSTRGVDLVIAIMGILKAGATFSVIDPAYPSQRQRIYLEVAKPRGLIVLEQAGKLSSEIETFIRTELDLRVTVPALVLRDDGSVRGGMGADGEDTLQKSQCHYKVLPEVILGPDSVGTLSFTSGSTGIPKGVRGRHFSLTHFFPWMATQFGLDSSSKFTMLSGIAHDPIQRDIFTPLFLGAELHVPTAEDIGTPGRLAEWMDQQKVSVTHLTPAMGQLLSAQASRKIPSLKNAFFVGDILTKRDCSRLQQLASNVDIVNMFGTTETQRAVSYYLIPALSKDPIYLDTKKEIIPAGKGMKDVQLLIVNRVDKSLQCGVGELGEIYVRSSGLAEGYLGPAELSAEKFMLNWFIDSAKFKISNESTIKGKWLGIRDRLYKTGDLGRYLPDASVECVGRSDDQIKIRGFRIELGEIDTHLSQHPMVRENVTLVRRDKDEEKILVSYFIPMENQDQLVDAPSISGSELEEDEDEVQKGIRKYRRLIKNIREYLKTKLPSYSIPSLFVPLVRMPLNPNGKIDKPALPFPDTALQASSMPKKSKENPSQLTASELTIENIWRSLLPSNLYSSSNIPLDENFFDLGGHSILATRLVFEIRRAMAVNIPLGLIFEHPTIRSLARHVDLVKNSDFGLAREKEDVEENKGLASSTPTSQLNLAPVAGASTFDYAADAKALTKTLRSSYPPLAPSNKPKTVFLTGVTGFLGVFILKELLDRPAHTDKVICHLRAKNREAGLARLRDSCSSRGFWNEEWLSHNRIEIVLGDLEARQIGIGDSLWNDLSERVDVVIHNGALVHWVYPYSKLRSANVMATLAVLSLVGTGKPKGLVFVSSTAVLEKDHYVSMSDALIQRGGNGIKESDDLEAASSGLPTGYGQTKWVSERIIQEAGRRGLSGGIIRPSYILGDLETGSSNVDDFLWRLVKGCVQVGSMPDINNTINMLPVDYVARCTVLAALIEKPLKVYQLTARPLPRFNQFLGSLNHFGYNLRVEDYLTWRSNLEQSIMTSEPTDNALFPLLHFVLNDLPTSTKSAELEDSNTVELNRAFGFEGGMKIGTEQIGLYLAWLIEIGYLPRPLNEEQGQRNLPNLKEKVDPKFLKSIGRSGH